jgi:hypothetical protein
MYDSRACCFLLLACRARRSCSRCRASTSRVRRVSVCHARIEPTSSRDILFSVRAALRPRRSLIQRKILTLQQILTPDAADAADAGAEAADEADADADATSAAAVAGRLARRRRGAAGDAARSRSLTLRTP